MKKGFILGGIISIVGLILITISMSLGGKQVLKSNERFEKTYTFDGNYDEISISDGSVPIYIKTSDDNKVHLTTFENEGQHYIIEDNNKLSINYVDKLPWFESVINLDSYDDYYLELSLPKDLITEIEIDGGNKDIYVNDISCKNLDIETVNGIVSISNITSLEDIDIKNINGIVNANECYAKDGFDIELVNGSTNLENIDFDRNSELSSVNGTININLLGSPDDYTIKGSSVNGDFIINDTSVENKHTFKQGYGAKHLSIDTVNGKTNLDYSNVTE